MHGLLDALACWNLSWPSRKRTTTYTTFIDAPLVPFQRTVLTRLWATIVGRENDQCIVAHPRLFECTGDLADSLINGCKHPSQLFARSLQIAVRLQVLFRNLKWAMNCIVGNVKKKWFRLLLTLDETARFFGEEVSRITLLSELDIIVMPIVRTVSHVCVVVDRAKV